VKTYVVVEGHGEVAAVGNLLSRLRSDLGLRERPWSPPIRGNNLLRAEGMARFAESVRSRSDADGLLILCDDEDGCPRMDAPKLASEVAKLNLPFPTSVVLAFREYETLFLPCIARMAGAMLQGESGLARPGLRADASWQGEDFEAKRDVKGWLSTQMQPGQIYKPRLDQLPLTRLVDFDTVRTHSLKWFGSLENGLRALDDAAPGSVYPGHVRKGNADAHEAR
jgi:hypothetical protein